VSVEIPLLPAAGQASLTLAREEVTQALHNNRTDTSACPDREAIGRRRHGSKTWALPCKGAQPVIGSRETAESAAGQPAARLDKTANTSMNSAATSTQWLRSSLTPLEPHNRRLDRSFRSWVGATKNNPG